MKVGAVLLLLPLCAVAEDILVDYEGTVVMLENDTPAGYAVGDSIAGRLTIDTTRAGEDKTPFDPSRSRWGSEFPAETGEDFVTGFLSSRQQSSDGVRLVNEDIGGADFFSVSDGIWGNTPRSENIFLSVLARDILQGDGLEQSFDVRLEDTEGAEHFFGMIRRGMNETYSAVIFELSRLTVRPKSCSI